MLIKTLKKNVKLKKENEELRSEIHCQKQFINLLISQHEQMGQTIDDLKHKKRNDLLASHRKMILKRNNYGE